MERKRLDKGGVMEKKYILKINCIICFREFVIDEYNGNTCPHCGQGYDYIEGQTIELNSQQLEILRAIKEIEQGSIRKRDKLNDDMVWIRNELQKKFPECDITKRTSPVYYGSGLGRYSVREGQIECKHNKHHKEWCVTEKRAFKLKDRQYTYHSLSKKINNWLKGE